MTDYRAVCVELVKALAEYDSANPQPDCRALIERVRAELAQPEPERLGAFFPVEYADTNGEGIRITMEPSEENGQTCWVVYNSRHVSPTEEFPTPDAAYAAHQTRAEQPPAKTFLPYDWAQLPPFPKP